MRLHDPRRFGAVVYVDSETDALAVKLLGRLGVEPLEDSFDPQRFALDLKKKHAPIKQVLLAGELVKANVALLVIHAVSWPTPPSFTLAFVLPTAAATPKALPPAGSTHNCAFHALAVLGAWPAQ